MTIEELQDAENFELIEKLDLDNMVPFLLKYFQKDNSYIKFYKGFTFFSILVFIVISSLDIMSGTITFSYVFTYASIGALLCFTILIVVHEMIHAIAYKMKGAKAIKFRAIWRKFIFYVVSHRSVIDGNSFKFIALAPFVCIGVIALMGYAFSPLPIRYIFLAIFSMHTLMVGGDFALLSLLEEHSGKEVYTYDDVDEGASFFYIRK